MNAERRRGWQLVRSMAIACVPPLFYVLFLTWLLWPLPLRLGSHLPATAVSCPFDPLLVAWALAHETVALTTAPATLPHGDIFHPDRYALFYGESGLGALPYFLPTFLLSGNPALALNLTWIGSLALTAWGLHLVTVRWTGYPSSGFIAGGGFVMTRWVLWTHVPCLPTYSLLQYFPWLVFLTAQPFRGLREALRFVPLLVLHGLSNVYLALAAIVPLALLGVIRLLRSRTRKPGLLLLGAVALSCAILAIPYGGHLLVRIRNPRLTMQTWWPVTLEANLPWGPFSYLTPTGVPLALLLVGVAGTLCVLLRKYPRRQQAEWTAAGFWVVTGMLLSLSPTVWWSDRAFDVPYLQPARWFGLYDVIRVPDRLGAGALVGFSLLAGLAFVEIIDGIGTLAEKLRHTGRARSHAVWNAPLRGSVRPMMAVLILALCYAEYARGPGEVLGVIRSQGFKVRGPGLPRPLDVPRAGLFTGPLPVSYPVAAVIPRDAPMHDFLARPGGPLLELPIGAGGGGEARLQARAQYRSIFHRRPLLNGYSGYWPAQFTIRMALTRNLPDPAAVQGLRQATGLELILVHTDELPPKERLRWTAVASGNSTLRTVAQHGGDILFAIAADGNDQP